MIDWNKHPEAAYADVTFFDETHCEIGSQLDISRPTQKTVADAYEWSKSAGGQDGWLHDDCDIIVTDSEGDFGYANSQTSSSKVFCTREQFEAYAKEQEAKQEGEKWTHTYSDYGVRKDCIIVHGKPDDYGMILVMNRRGEYVLTDNFEEKPIKPKLTVREYDLLVDIASHFDIDTAHFTEYMSKFDSKLID